VSAPRQAVVDAARRLVALGLAHGTSGNVSLRDGDGFVITPSAVGYDVMEPEDVVGLELDGTIRGGAPGRIPSSEWRLHAGILATRPEFDCVVHAHSPWATALSCLRREIPPFHYMVAAAGGADIRCAAYATFGTAELAAAAREALRDRRACLLANHGLVACGPSAAAALGLAVEVEALAGQYMRALSVGRPALLSDEEMGTVLRRFGTYSRGEPLPDD
jgi:L-fuculose-phosphate aldolase